MIWYTSGFVVWVALSVLSGVIAHKKNRSWIGYFFLSILLSPLVGLLAAALLPQLDERAAHQQSVAKFAIPIGLFIILGLLLGYGLKLDPRKIPSPLIGKPLPSYTLPTVADAGRSVSLESLRGRAYLLNVWASWCVACRQEHAILNELARRKTVPIIGLNYKDQRADAVRWLASLGNPYETSLSDLDGRLGIELGVYGVPETFLIDAQGIIRHKFIGPLGVEDINGILLTKLAELSRPAAASGDEINRR